MTKEEILKIVCDKLAVTKKEILTANRKREVVEARQIISLLLTEQGMTPYQISRFLKQTPANIYYHIEKLRNDILIYPLLHKQYEIMKILTTPTPEPSHESKTIQKPARGVSYTFERRTEAE